MLKPLMRLLHTCCLISPLTASTEGSGEGSSFIGGETEAYVSRSSRVIRPESCKVGIFPGMSAQRGELCRPEGVIPLCASVSPSLKQRGNLPMGDVGDNGYPSLAPLLSEGEAVEP